MSIFDCHLHFFSRDFFAAKVRQKNPAAEVEQVLGDLAQRAKIEIPPGNVQRTSNGGWRSWIGSVLSVPPRLPACRRKRLPALKPRSTAAIGSSVFAWLIRRWKLTGLCVTRS